MTYARSIPAAALLCLLTACSGSSGGGAANAAAASTATDSATDSETPEATDSATPDQVDAITAAASAKCDALSAADVSSMVGFAVKAPIGLQGEPTTLHCSYVADASTDGGALILVMQKGNAAEVVTVQRKSFEMLQEKEVVLSGVGDEAYFATMGGTGFTTSTVVARRGDNTVALTLARSGSADEKHMAAVAQKALTAFAL